MLKVAVLDDYQNAFQQIVEVDKYKDKFEFKVFNNPFNDEKETIVELEDFEALLIISLGASNGALVSFLLARFTLKNFLEKKFKLQIGKVNKGLEDNGILYLFFLRTVKVLGSYSSPDTSFIIFTPNLIPLSMILDFLVSKETGNFFTINLKILLILTHSIFSLIDLDPGLVDSPPTSIKSAPFLYSFHAWSIPFFFVLNFPPSEKLSGVRFNTPNIFGIFIKFRLEKFFFLELIFVKSKFILFLRF